MKDLLQRLTQGYAALPAPRRYLLLGGWVVVLTLVLVLLGRPLVDYVRSVQQWQALAGQARLLQRGDGLSNERWQALASARGVTLTAVEQRGEVWQVRGEVSRAEKLAQLMRGVQEQGARPLRWSLEQSGAGLVFNLDVSRSGAQP
ncbi:type II secretion system protein GspM [Pseudomonas sp. 21LCFQ010]|uniref:type II secretion system protein GspM n=1 Tax=Pseudomonas sp. 21LCFQ010 TaxID=2957506 RepID=UPI0020970273|nr:type II secretion system protein GspM [Pseudomonas sp. 21LCFQ010]MCO8166070.1 type II secretion system protein GspM [Pseudomonas sp. 21LCFQ010]